MSNQHQQHGNDKVELLSGGDFGEGITFTVGLCYCTGFLLGVAKGLRHGIPTSMSMPRKRIVNHMFNCIGKETTSLGNAFAAGGVLYYFNGTIINLVGEEYLDEYEPIYKNMLCGGATGMLFKSLRGFYPSLLGGTIGVAMMGGLTVLVEKGNKYGLVGFEIKF